MYTYVDVYIRIVLRSNHKLQILICINLYIIQIYCIRNYFDVRVAISQNISSFVVSKWKCMEKPRRTRTLNIFLHSLSDITFGMHFFPLLYQHFSMFTINSVAPKEAQIFYLEYTVFTFYNTRFCLLPCQSSRVESNAYICKSRQSSTLPSDYIYTCKNSCC